MAAVVVPAWLIWGLVAVCVTASLAAGAALWAVARLQANKAVNTTKARTVASSAMPITLDMVLANEIRLEPAGNGRFLPVPGRELQLEIGNSGSVSIDRVCVHLAITPQPSGSGWSQGDLAPLTAVSGCLGVGASEKVQLTIGGLPGACSLGVTALVWEVGGLHFRLSNSQDAQNIMPAWRVDPVSGLVGRECGN